MGVHGYASLQAARAWHGLVLVTALLFSASHAALSEQAGTAGQEARRTLDLKTRMNLAGECLLNWLDPTHGYAPTGGWSVPHDTGRWWDAMLRLEATTGFSIPADAEAAMRRNLRRFTDNPDGLLLAPPGLDWLEPHPELHSIREAMLAFTALVEHRDSVWAREHGHRLLQTLDSILQPDGTLDVTRLDYFRYVTDPARWLQSPEAGGDRTGSTGRAIEALVWFHQATGDPLALELAGRFAEYHLVHTVNADGSMRQEIIDPSNIGHSHSYLGTLRGLLLYGLLTGRRDVVDAVAATYRGGVKSHVVMESGWAGHDLGRLRFPNAHGESVTDLAAPGDAAQLALWLALDAGQADLLDDVERLVRARLLPSQATEDGLGPKTLGGWGIVGEPHAAKGCILDVCAAVVHTLCDVYNHIVERSDSGLRVNLHLDYSDEHVSVTSTRGETAEVTVRLRQQEDLLIRVPGWAPRATVGVAVDGRKIPPAFVGSFVRVGREDARPGAEIVLRYGLPVRETTETMSTGRTFRFRWRGDEIIGIDPQEGSLPFYPALSEEA